MKLTTLLASKATEADYHRYLALTRWPDEVICPYCRGRKNYSRKTCNGYKCGTCTRSFTVTTGTIFHATKIPLRKWFLAIHLITQAVKGISSLQLARTLQVNKNTAWYMQYRIREGMKKREINTLLNIRPEERTRQRRHRNRLRPASERPVKDIFYTTAPNGLHHRQLMNRAIQGQYHRLSRFHLRSYEQEVHYKKTCYRDWIHLSLLSRMCAFM